MNLEDLKKVVNNAQIIEVGNDIYIGVFSEESDSVVVEFATRFREKEDIVIWLQELNLGRTKRLNLKGARSVRISDLTPEVKAYAMVAVETMTRAKEHALSWAENQVFKVFMDLTN